MYKLKLYDVDSVLVFDCESDTIWGVFSQHDMLMKEYPLKYDRAVISKDGQHWITTTMVDRLKQVLMLF